MMRAYIQKPDERPDCPHRLFLLPATTADLSGLEQLARCGKVIEFFSARMVR